MVRILLKEIELSVLQKILHPPTLVARMVRILPISVRGQCHRDVKDSVFNPSVVAVVPRVLEFLLGKSGDFMDPDGLVERLKLIRPNQPLTRHQPHHHQTRPSRWFLEYWNS